MTPKQEIKCTETEDFLKSEKGETDGANGDGANGDACNAHDKGLSRETSRVTEKPWIDKGWAWVVALGSLSVMFVCMGQIRNMGLLLAEVKLQFSESTAIAAILPSVVYLIMPMMSPISSVLTAHYGSRPVVFTGVLITVLAHVSVMFATSITHILIFYAIPLAVGTGLCYTATCIIVSRYFNKKTSLAFGVASSGAPIAGLTLPSFYTYLSGQYGFKGAMLLLGGIAAHAAIGVCLMRPLEFWETTPAKNNEQEMKVMVTKTDDDDGDDEADIVSETHGRSLERLNSMTSHRSRTISILADTITASQIDLNETKDSEDDSLNSDTNTLLNCFKKINKVFRFSLLKETPFLIHLVVSCCGFVGYVLTYALISSHALDLGTDRLLAYFLISVGGMGDLPGRYILSYIADKWSAKPYGKKYHLMSVCMLISGINSILIAFSTSYAALCVQIIFVGFCGGGGFIGANVAVLKETIGLTKTANGGLGITMFTSGILIGILPPVLGLMRDNSGSFKVPFIIIGVIMMFGGCFTWLQRLAVRSQKNKERAKQTTNGAI